MNAAAGERVQINRQRGHQGLSFAGLHFRDFSVVQHDAAHELHVEVTHVQGALRRLAADGERFRQQIAQRFLQIGLCSFHRDLVAGHFFLRRIEGFDDRTQAVAKLRSLSAKFVVRKFGNLRLERIDLRDERKHALHVALVLRAKNGCQYFVDHRFSFA